MTTNDHAPTRSWRPYLDTEIRRLLLLELPFMVPSPYDAAWLGRLTDGGGAPSYPQMLPWLLTQQHADGSWGSDAFFLPDRVLTTLSVVNFLASRADAPREAQERGEGFLRRRAGELRADDDLTVGFELLLPAHVAEARRLGLAVDHLSWDFIDRAAKKKRAQLSTERLLAPTRDCLRPENTALFSLEAFVGDLPDLESAAHRILRRDGSVWTSPSATAALMTRVPNWSARFPATRAYLDAALTMCGGLPPNFAPYQYMMRGWIAYYLFHGGCWPQHRTHVRHHLDFLRAAWGPNGIGSDEGIPPDADDSAMSIFLTSQSDTPLDFTPLLAFERDDRFLDYSYGGHSVSTNLHVLEASASFPEPHRQRIRDKIVAHLLSVRQEGAWWNDRWNVSPHYSTSNALIAIGPLANEPMRATVRWVLESQHDSGGWGFLGEPTREETAMELLALTVARNSWAPEIPETALHRAARFLASRETSGTGHFREPALWKSKVLYAPIPFVRAALLGALTRYIESFGEAHLPPPPPVGLL
ncbi:hypothetical protein LZC95_34270 [Pendulispora brunnea]|uniref:Squalene cyclase C-terminal domain-containing protein n=1 Tax=Pendulispora brunnea TaxID=2905690 RepID=A0ABZ2JYH0_9BACT